MSRFHVNRAATVVARIVAAVCAVAAVAFAAGSGKTGEQPNTLAGSSGMNALGSGDIIVGGSPTTPPEFSDFMITFDESLAAGTVALGTLDLANVPGNTTLQAASELTLNDDVMFSLPIDVVFEARGLLRAFNHVNGAFALTCNADADGDGTGDLDLRRPVNVSGPATFAGAQVFVDKVWAASITIDDPFAVERDLIATGDIVLNADGFFDGINASFPNQTVDAATLTANGDLFKSTTGDLTIVSVNPAVTAGEVVVATGALLIEAPLVTASARYLSDGNMTVDADVLSLDVTGSSYLESANGMLHVTGTILPGAGSTIAFSAGTSIDLDGEINGIADIEITDPCTLGGNVVVDGFTLEGAATFDGAGDQAVVTGPITTQDEVLKTTPGALRFFGSDVDLNGDVIVTDGNLEVNASTSLHVAGTLGAWLNLIVFNDLTLDGAGAQTIDSGSGNVTLAAETIKTTAGDLTLSAFHDVLLPQRLSVTDGHLVVTSDDALVGADLIEVSNGDAIFDTDVTFNGPTTVDAATVRLVQEVVVGFGSVQNFNALGGITFEPASELLIEFADPYTFDQVIAGGEVELQGGALRVTIPEEPPTGMAYPVILAGTRIGEFGTVTIEVGDPPVPSTRGSVTYEPDEVVLHFDDPAGIGGCCLTSGICWTTTFASCQSVGGAWQGAASSCATVTCPIPIGSCCLPGDICLNLTLAACQAFTGAYQGNGSDCTACVPATGSCCLPSGACTDGVTADVCAAMPGAYQGDGTTCAGDPCPPPPPTGACCLPDGACTEVPAGPCISVGGTFFGPASTCAVVSCPSTPLIGACCYSGGTCGPTQQATCLQAGGLWLGPASSCATNPCPTPTGACCLGDNCVVLPSLACLTMGGTYKGHGTECPASCN